MPTSTVLWLKDSDEALLKKVTGIAINDVISFKEITVLYLTLAHVTVNHEIVCIIYYVCICMGVNSVI